MEKGDSIYNIVEHQPQYHGGIDAELAFIAKNIRYSKDARNKGKKGHVIIQYVVEKDGSITNIHIVKSLYPSLDAEAIRIIALMPKWEPGRMHGKAVRCKYTLPVNFK